MPDNQVDPNEDMRILLADDDPTLRTLLRGMLQKWGYQVQEVINGEDALAAMTQPEPPRLVLLDWAMPIVDGLEVCQVVKDRLTETGNYTHIIMLTNHDSPSSLAAALEAGANDFMKKPAEPLELRARLEAGRRIIAYEKTLLAQIQASRWHTYRNLCVLAESRDKAGLFHLERVGEYASILARQLGAPKEMVADMGRFAPLHDIGKVGVPESILLIPGELSAEQFGMVATHAELGGRILQGAPELSMAATICRSHHEKWDGTGYPTGLMGEEIPIEGRIVAVADVYDALRSRRHYKPPWSHDKALTTIREEAGGHFDPRVVDVFCDMEALFRDIAADYETPGGDYN